MIFLFTGPGQFFYIGATDMFMEQKWVYLSDRTPVPVMFWSICNITNESSIPEIPILPIFLIRSDFKIVYRFL